MKILLLSLFMVLISYTSFAATCYYDDDETNSGFQDTTLVTEKTCNLGDLQKSQDALNCETKRSPEPDEYDYNKANSFRCKYRRAR